MSPSLAVVKDRRALILAVFLVRQGLTNQKSIAEALFRWNQSNEPPMGVLEGDPDDVMWWCMAKALYLKMTPSRSELRSTHTCRRWCVPVIDPYVELPIPDIENQIIRKVVKVGK